MYSGKIKLAIVDDHPMILEGLKSLLQSETRLEIFTFTKGEAFLDFIRGNIVDMVLLDIVLNDGSGLNFCKTLRQWNGRKLPIRIMLFDEFNRH